MALWRHQAEAVEFILKHRKAALGHDTGTGKSLTAIETANRIDAKRTLTLCPPIACAHWVGQFKQWSLRPRETKIVRSGDADLHLANVLIVPFSLLSTRPQLARRLKQYDFDLVIIDEAHALKNPESNRTEAVYGLEARDRGLIRAPYVILLSATLMPNNPSELWPHIRALRPDLLGPAQGFDTFVDRYCETRTTWRSGRPLEQIVGAKRAATPDLKRRLETFIHRARKKDVQKDLPPVIVDIWPVSIADIAVAADLVDEWRVAEGMLKRDIGEATGEDMLLAAKRSPHLATQRRLTGAIKFHAMTALLEQEFDASARAKVIAFSFHRAVVKALAAWFSAYGVVTVDGSTPPDKRNQLVEAFQTDPKIRLFNGQIQVAGESIDLTAASTMYIFESDWTPKTITQAIGRANRPGQKEPLTVRIVTLADSIDDAITRTLARKARDIEMLEPA